MCPDFTCSFASNSKLEQNSNNQVEIYSKANSTKNTFKVILYFNSIEYKKVMNVLTRIGREKDENIILINAGKSGKESASNVK